jgi:hypothetical protein
MTSPTPKSIWIFRRLHQNSCSFVFRILCDVLGHHAFGDEGKAVCLHFKSRTVFDERHQACVIGLALAKHVDVHGGTCAGNADRLQQQRAFQNDALRMPRLRDAIQESLHRV